MRTMPLGDSALIVEVGETADEATHERVQQVLRLLEETPLPGVIEIVPAFATVTLFFDPTGAVAAGAPPENITGWLDAKVSERLAGATIGDHPGRGRTVEIPVCYARAFGPDLAAVSKATGLSDDEVIRKHLEGDYLVRVLGFAPGFPYLAGLAPELRLPRRATPRQRVPAGSVAIAGDQCCIYSMETPGGWNILGRTPVLLFQVNLDPPALLRPGDRVRFRPMAIEEFEKALRP